MNTSALRLFTLFGAVAVGLAIAALSANAGGYVRNNPPPPGVTVPKRPFTFFNPNTQFNLYAGLQNSTHGLTIKVPK